MEKSGSCRMREDSTSPSPELSTICLSLEIRERFREIKFGTISCCQLRKMVIGTQCNELHSLISIDRINNKN
jgi:hypothetical protein